jgi:hypothetical protein
MHGTSADRQLRVYDANDGDLKAVVDHLIARQSRGWMCNSLRTCAARPGPAIT